jgi:6-phosphogluconolactonase (cycloisomerase 2 family)
MGKIGERFRAAVRGGAIGVLAVAATLLTGCAGFFDAPSSSSSSTTSNSGDYVYVVNELTDTLGAFNLGTGTLVSIPSGAYTLPSGLVPRSVAVSRANTFVYVGGNGAIECYSIGSSGALTQATSGGITTVANFVSLATSPDGKWLIALDDLALAIDVYAINTSTGALSLAQSVTSLAANLPSGSQGLSSANLPSTVRIAPGGNYVAVAMGPAGDELFSFNTSTGALTSTAGVITSSGFSDNAVEFDSTSSYLFIARGVTGSSGSSSIVFYPINSNGTFGTQSTIASGASPHALVMDSTGKYLYAANSGDATISAYSFSSGTLTALSSSPYKSGTTVTALVRDNSARYILAASQGVGSSSGIASDVTMYALDEATPGQLDAISAAASGSDPAGSLAIAATH